MMTSAVRQSGLVVDELTQQFADRLHAALILLLVFSLTMMATAVDAVTMLKR